MSRGPVARSDAIGEQLPESLVTLMRIDVRAQQHALVEGAADPFPSPPRARGRARGRAKAVAGPPRGVGTHVADSGANRHTSEGRPHGTTPPQSGTTFGGDVDE